MKNSNPFDPSDPIFTQPDENGIVVSYEEFLNVLKRTYLFMEGRYDEMNMVPAVPNYCERLKRTSSFGV